MAGSQTVFSILDEAAAAIGGWTALQSIRCVHLDSEGEDWEPWQAHDIGGTVDVLWRRDKRLHGLPNPRDDGTSMRWKGYRE